MQKTNRPLSVSFVYDDSLDGNEGVAQYVKGVGSWMAHRGHNVSYIVGETKINSFDESPVYSAAKNIPVRFNGNKLSIPLPSSTRKIKHLLRSINPDILHVQMPHSPFMAQKIVNNSKTASVIGTFHIFPANRLVSVGTKILKLFYGRGLNRFDKVVSVSSAAQSFANSSMGIISEVLPNVVDIEKFKSSLANQPYKIVFLGRLVERKGARQLINAFSKVLVELPEARLVIAGGGQQRRELEDLCAKMKISDKVEFLGFIEETAKADLLASAHIACFPSLYGESFGIVLIEAMAAGSGMVVGGNNPGYASVLGPQPRLLINPNDTEKFADRLIQLLKNKQTETELHKWQNTYVQQFDVNEVGKKLEAIYYSAIDNKTIKRHN